MTPWKPGPVLDDPLKLATAATRKDAPAHAWTVQDHRPADPDLDAAMTYTRAVLAAMRAYHGRPADHRLDLVNLAGKLDRALEHLGAVQARTE